MITMEMLGKIRRMHLRDKLSLHEIAKRTGLARNTIRSWLRTTREAVPPTYRRSPGAVKLSQFHAAVEQALKVDAHRNKQNRRTAKALFAQIKADGYVGGYSQLTAFIRDWRGKEGKAPHAFVPLKFDLGEAFQFDWSEEGLVIGGIYPAPAWSACNVTGTRCPVSWPGSESAPVSIRPRSAWWLGMPRWPAMIGSLTVGRSAMTGSTTFLWWNANRVRCATELPLPTCRRHSSS